MAGVDDRRSHDQAFGGRRQSAGSRAVALGLVREAFDQVDLAVRRAADALDALRGRGALSESEYRRLLNVLAVEAHLKIAWGTRARPAPSGGDVERPAHRMRVVAGTAPALRRRDGPDSA